MSPEELSDFKLNLDLWNYPDDSLVRKAAAHIVSQAAQIEALKEKLIQERGKYIAVYEEDEWDFDDLPELDAREYIRTAHQQLKAEMPEVEWE